MTKKQVAVAMGGYSSESEISKKSGQVVIAALDKTLFDVYGIHIDEEDWYFLESDGTKNQVDRSNFSFEANGTQVTPDVVFNTVHGTPGEDGYLQAYWELLRIPHTSTSFYAAALSFNKRDSLSVLKNFGVKCANSYYVNKDQPYNTTEIVKKVGLPCFVKPNRAGSSFGISRVTTLEAIDAALEIAFAEDSEVLIETELVGTEVSVGVYTSNGEVIALPPTEIVSENDFFDYEAKYEGKSEEITPARISEEETQRVQEESKRIHQLLNMKGVTRSDFIIQEGVPYFIEINTTPGLSKESIIPQQARAAGMNLTAFFGLLINESLQA
jgi:D-alanine-D-alanine ligase